MKVFILKKTSGEFPSVNCYIADEGFRKLGCEVEYFNCRDAFKDLDISKETPVYGSIDAVAGALKMVGAKIPPVNSYPKSLRKFLNREITETTFGRCRDENFGGFVKPARKHKYFTGQMFNYLDYQNAKHIADDEPVYACPYYHFISEYRCFVHKRKLVDVRRYKGAVDWYIDTGVVEEAIEAFEEQPIAYGLDFALGARDTTLVEFNDMSSLGCYGISSVKYATMVADRWYEIVGLPIPSLQNTGPMFET